jgi:hypothetical protein
MSFILLQKPIGSTHATNKVRIRIRRKYESLFENGDATASRLMFHDPNAGKDISSPTNATWTARWSPTSSTIPDEWAERWLRRSFGTLRSVTKDSRITPDYADFNPCNPWLIHPYTSFPGFFLYRFTIASALIYATA